MTGLRRILVTGSRTWTDTAIIAGALRRWRSPGAALVDHGVGEVTGSLPDPRAWVTADRGKPRGLGPARR